MGKSQNGTNFALSVDEIEVSRLLLSLPDEKLCGRSLLVIVDAMWKGGHNSVIIPVAKYLLFVEKLPVAEIKRCLYRYLVYSTYIIKRPDFKSEKLLIKEFDMLNERVNRAKTPTAAANAVMKFLREGAINEKKTESCWACHFNKGTHPYIFLEKKGFEDTYTDEEKQKYWPKDQISGRDKTRMAAVIDLFRSDTVPTYVFDDEDNPPKFDVIIASLLNGGANLIQFTFKCENEPTILENILSTREAAKELVAFISHHLLVMWSKDTLSKNEEVFKPVGDIGLRHVSDYKVLVANKNFKIPEVRFVVDDRIDWESVSAFTFRLKSPNVFDGKMHEYEMTQDGLKKLD